VRAVAGLRPVDQAHAVVLGNQRYRVLSFSSSRPHLTNTGTRAGADVSQLYLSEAGVDKRMRLLGFERLEANLVVTLTDDPRLLARYDGSTGRCRITQGTYRVALARVLKTWLLTAEIALVARLFGN
jgi:beta-glucosidase